MTDEMWRFWKEVFVAAVHAGHDSISAGRIARGALKELGEMIAEAQKAKEKKE